MRTQPTRLQRLLVAVVGLALAVGVGGWLSLSYFGIVTDDAKVSADLTRLGDSLGPGAKVRHRGIIVGRVLSVERHDEAYRVTFLVKGEHAEHIPGDATVRVLPSTLFGSEYVELVGDGPAGDQALASGDVLAADDDLATLRLMESYDQAERLLSAIDVEAVNRVTDQAARALDGNGADVKEFLEDAADTAGRYRADLDLTWSTLRQATAALDVFDDVEPDLVDAIAQSGPTLETLAARDAQIGRTLEGATGVVERGETLVDANDEVLVPFVGRVGRLTDLVVDQQDDLRAVLAALPILLNNGGSSIDANAIQMIGTIGVDPMEPYTAEDCARYGSGLVATNCGGPMPPAEDPAPAADPGAGVGTILEDLAAVLEQAEESPAPAATPSPTPTATLLPGVPAPADPISGLLDLLSGLGGRLGVAP